MKIEKLSSILSEVEKSPYIQWNDKSLVSLIENDPVYSVFIFNKDKNHGYFSLLHKLTSNTEGIVVEVGNREGLSILSVYDALSSSSIFYTLDIVNDVRFVPDKIKEDNRVKIMNDFNSLDSKRISKEFSEKSISLIFFDTIHTYEQISQEYKLWSPYLKDDCVMLIDDIRDIQLDRTKNKFHRELDWEHKFDVTEWAHNNTGFGVYLK